MTLTFWPSHSYLQSASYSCEPRYTFNRIQRTGHLPILKKILWWKEIKSLLIHLRRPDSPHHWNDRERSAYRTNNQGQVLQPLFSRWRTQNEIVWPEGWRRRCRHRRLLPTAFSECWQQATTQGDFYVLEGSGLLDWDCGHGKEPVPRSLRAVVLTLVWPKCFCY